MSRARRASKLAPAALAVRALTVALAALAIRALGCSSDEAPPASASVVVDAGPNRPALPEPPPPDASSCQAACEETFGAGASANRALDTCWERSCRGACVLGLGPSDGGVDAGDAGDAGDAPTCAPQRIVTISPACDACTRTSCCAEWQTCFGDEACRNLNACLQRCP